METIRLIITVVGVLCAIFLSNRSLSRAEILKLKERLTDKLEKIQAFCVDEVKKKQLNDLELEQYVADKILIVERRVAQLNSYVGVGILDEKRLASVRGIDFKDYKEDSGCILKSINSEFSEIIELIEEGYDSYFKQNNFFKRIWLRSSFDVLGMAVILIILFVLLCMVQRLYPLFDLYVSSCFSYKD